MKSIQARASECPGAKAIAAHAQSDRRVDEGVDEAPSHLDQVRWEVGIESRQDGAVLGAIEISISKARTAALFRAPTEALWDYARPGGPSPGLENSNGGLVVFPGGLPLFDATGQLIGAIGVSGGAPSQDLDIAKAAAAALAA